MLKRFLAWLNGQIHKYPNADAPDEMEQGKSYPPRGRVAEAARRGEALPESRRLISAPTPEQPNRVVIADD